MSTRILFACWPFEGHVFPQMRLALTLRERGAEVAFFTGSRLSDVVAAQDIPVFGLGRVEGAWQAVHDRERAVGGRAQSRRVAHEAFRRWLVESIPDQVAELHALIRDWRPDVIVADASMWGPSLILHESEPIPVALAAPLIYAVVPGPDAPPPGSRMPRPTDARGRARARAFTRITDLVARGTRTRIDHLRAQHGLEPMGRSINAQLARLPLYLVASIPELDYSRRDLPSGVHYVGPLQWHPPDPPGTTAWLDEIPAARPWVHVTEGTSHYQDPFVLRSAAAGLAGGPYEAILTTGRDRDPARLGLPEAPNVHVTTWAAHDELLPRCDVVVTTGGAGSVMACVRAGVPMVLVPTTWDKPDHARRMVDAGVAVRLSPRRCSPESLRAAVEQVLGDPRFRATARQHAQRLAAAPGPDGAAALVEALVPRDRGGDRAPAVAEEGAPA
ncbi:MAG TPA: glycosyltransferase [Solirubrobacteraceae bacterium]|nr:glycosyltransferase [Solirubrobacteraceae bacterium]